MEFDLTCVNYLVCYLNFFLFVFFLKKNNKLQIGEIGDKSTPLGFLDWTLTSVADAIAFESLVI